MNLKPYLFSLILILSHTLKAQIIAFNEGTIANFKKILELPDGSVIAGIDASYYGESYSNFTLLKFDSTGKLMEEFANKGKYRYKAERHSEEEKQVMSIEDMLLLEDGKILITGSKNVWDDNIFLLRLNSDGTPDSSYGTNGYAMLKNAFVSKPIIRLIKIDMNTIIVGFINDYGRIGSFKVNEAGVADESYGNDNGKFSFKNDDQKAYYSNYGNIEKDGKNRVYFTMFCQSDQQGHIIQIYRVNPDGKLDSAFGNEGVKQLLTDKEYKQYFKAGNIQFTPDYKIFVSLKYYVIKNNLTSGHQCVLKLRENGQTDTGFATKGIARFIITPGENTNSKIALLPDGKLMTWNIADLKSSENNYKTNVLISRRLTKNGQVDKTYGKNGVLLNTLLQVSGTIDFKEMQSSGKYFYVYGRANNKGSEDYMSAMVKLKFLPNNKLSEVIKNDFVYSETNTAEGIGITVSDVTVGKANKNDIAITQGDQGAKQASQEEKNLMAMIKTIMVETEKVYKVFNTFDKNQMSGGLVSLDFVTNSEQLEKAFKDYINLSNSFAGGKYGIRTVGWKNYVPLSLFNKREGELVNEMKNLIDHIDKSLEYIDKFTKENKRMPAGVGNTMEMADYKFRKRIEEFIKTYKNISLE